MWRYYRYLRPTIGALKPLEHIRELLVDGLAYFPRPSQLNDSSDRRPRMLRPSTAEIEAYVVQRGSAKYPGRTSLEERGERKRYARGRLGNARTLQRLWASDAERFGVLSLSKSKCNAHMWRAYADAGAGICIEFNFEQVIDRGLVDWVPFVVEYEEHLPEMNLLEYRRPDPAVVKEFVRRSFGVKSRKWAVEEEVRVAILIEKAPPKVRVPDGVLSAIVLGPAVSDTHRMEILSWKTALPVLEAKMNEAGHLSGFGWLR